MLYCHENNKVLAAERFFIFLITGVGFLKIWLASETDRVIKHIGFFLIQADFITSWSGLDFMRFFSQIYCVFSSYMVNTTALKIFNFWQKGLDTIFN